MSSIIKGTSITLTRGDTLRVKIGIFSKEDGTEYIPTSGDSIRFAVKHPVFNSKKTEYKDTQPLIIKNIPYDTMVLELQPNDTKPLGFGEYVYDIQITYSDGRVDTFITQAILKLTPEVQ